MKSNFQGWLLLIAGAVLAWHVILPESAKYHGQRLAKLPTKPSQPLLEAETERAADAYRLPRRLLKALVHVESGYNPKAVSQVGAIGAAQIMPFNASRCGLSKSHLWDATYNLRCGARILREEIDRLGNLSDALAVYNCGKPRCVEGQKYAKKVLSLSKFY